MITFLMKALKYLMIATIFGTVMCESNLEEICSKEYFDRVIKKRVDKKPYIELRISLICHLIGGPLPEYQLKQPKECPKTISRRKLNDSFLLINRLNDSGGPVLANKGAVMVKKSWRRNASIESWLHQESIVVNASDIYLTALICEYVNKIQVLYIFGENGEPKVGNRRTQFVEKISLNRKGMSRYKEVWPLIQPLLLYLNVELFF